MQNAEGVLMTFHLERTDATMVKLVSLAAVEALQTTTGVEGKLHALNESPALVSTGHISAVLCITGEAGQSNMILSFPRPLATLLVSRFMNISQTQITSDECSDGICELANMIAGRLKTTLSEASGSLYRLSVPTMLSDAEPGLPKQQEPCLTLVFEAEGQQFQITLSLKSVK